MKIDITSTAAAEGRFPLVSVVMITYNQEDFVTHAISSVLRQDCLMDCEVIVADDASTDQTVNTLKGRITDENRVKLLTGEPNMGAQRNLRRSLENAHGEYVAFLEGDDFWTDPQKLSLQRMFLDTHPDCVAVGHLTVVDTGQSDGSDNYIFGDGSSGLDRLTLTDVLAGAMPHLSSLFYRRSALPTTPLWFDELPAADWSITALLATKGCIAIIPKNMSTYRKNPYSTWTPRSQLERKQLHLAGLVAFDRNVDHQSKSFPTFLAGAHSTVAAVALHDRRFRLAWHHGLAALRASPSYLLRRGLRSIRRRIRGE